MATATDTLAIAAGELGYNRYTDPETGTKYGRWYADLVGDRQFAANGVAFCAMGASWVFDQAGVSCAGFPGAYTPYMLNAAKREGAVLASKHDAKAGDIAYFNWDGGVVDHVGFIERPYSSYVQTIEFNVNGGKVERRTRAWSTIEAVVRPNYTSGESAVTVTDNPKEADDVKPIYNEGGEIRRVYNPNTGDHHYCVKIEAEALVSQGWQDEGTAFTAPKGGTVAVYRMYNPNDGDHMFTASYDEAHSLEKKGWTLENVPFFGVSEGNPVYRLYNPNTGDHLLTESRNERDDLIGRGWKDEGVAFYMPR